MIRIISEAVVRWLELEGAVSSNDYQIYRYAVYSCLWGLLPIVMSLTLGMILGMVVEGAILIVPFIVLRKFCGGLHLESSKHCLIVSICVLTFAMGLIKYYSYTEKIEELFFVVLLSVACLCKFSPIDNCARKLSEREKAIFGKIARALSIISLFIFFFEMYYAPASYASAFGIGISLVALLQILWYGVKRFGRMKSA